MLNSLRLVLVCLAVSGLQVPVPATAAEIYKWVDSRGRTHFGDKPPDSGAATTRIKTPTNPAPRAAPDTGERLRKQQKLLDAFSSERKERENKRSKNRREKARLKRNCTVARSNLAALQRANLLYRKDKDGNRQYASEAQHQQLIAQYKAALKKHCKSH